MKTLISCPIRSGFHVRGLRELGVDGVTSLSRLTGTSQFTTLPSAKNYLPTYIHTYLRQSTYSLSDDFEEAKRSGPSVVYSGYRRTFVPAPYRDSLCPRACTPAAAPAARKFSLRQFHRTPRSAARDFFPQPHATAEAVGTASTNSHPSGTASTSPRRHPWPLFHLRC